MSNGLVWLTDPKSSGFFSGPGDEMANPDRSEDGRLMYYEHQVQPLPGAKGVCSEIPIEELRAFMETAIDYTGVCEPLEFPLPPAGLPGFLHQAYDVDDYAGKIIALGVAYVGAIIRNERRAMHLRWRDAHDLASQIERDAQRKYSQYWAADNQRKYDEQMANQRVYFIGTASGPIKIGIAVKPHERLKTLQTSHHEPLELLATCEGGMEQERAYHKLFKARRIKGEWFERCPEIEAEIERLTNA